MLIGKSDRPRSSGRMCGHERGVDFYFDQKTWMIQTLLFSWPARFDRYFGHSSSRKILLMIDNCSAHGSKKTLPTLNHIRPSSLPPNTSSKIQALDAGTISQVEENFRGRLLHRAFESIEAETKSVYNVDILTALRWICTEWDNLSVTCITNYFHQCF